VQAHGAGITSMVVTYANDVLISAAKDGTLMIHEIKDRDPRGLVTRNFD
jgi:hypothetical protein